MVAWYKIRGRKGWKMKRFQIDLAGGLDSGFAGFARISWWIGYRKNWEVRMIPIFWTRKWVNGDAIYWEEEHWEDVRLRVGNHNHLHPRLFTGLELINVSKNLENSLWPIDLLLHPMLFLLQEPQQSMRSLRGYVWIQWKMVQADYWMRKVKTSWVERAFKLN